ncbi:hypothetical protein [Azospirillum sp. Sh1]|uniref:hypothetical protein n=1 Tax=Azospirillum sp. Sh1 TaxID=2607285 RepID=UPI00165E6F60|nr:hypothetical protein [Azospirillum sp. Sh1]
MRDLVRHGLGKPLPTPADRRLTPFATAEDFPPMIVTRLSLPLWKELRSRGPRVRPMPA